MPTHRTTMPEADVGTGYRLAQIVPYIDRHLGRSLPISELASEACMSEPTFYRVFRRTFGMPPLAYINRRRICLAVKLLENTDRCIDDIGKDCGFNAPNYFVRLFRRQIGLSPTQYRQRRPLPSALPTAPNN